jgi:hypothetical protein
MVKELSRQQRWQKERRDKNLCIACGKEPLVTKNHGAKCAKRIREKARKQTHATKRYSNSASYGSAVPADYRGTVRHDDPAT